MTPAYYKFLSGVQVIEVSRYLTSNVGQAVQYLCRSSRLDGVNKTDSPLEDLMKARDMIVDEIARVQELEFDSKPGYVRSGGDYNPIEYQSLSAVPDSITLVYDSDGELYCRAGANGQWWVFNRNRWEIAYSDDFPGPFMEKKP